MTMGFPRRLESDTSRPSIEVSVKSGAAEPTGTVSLSTGMAFRILGVV